MSVASSLALTADIRPSDLLEGYEGYGLARIHVGALRSLQRADGSPCPQGVMPAPTAEEPWHCVVFDWEARPRKGAVQNAIAKVAEWEIPLIND